MVSTNTYCVCMSEGLLWSFASLSFRSRRSLSGEKSCFFLNNKIEIPHFRLTAGRRLDSLSGVGRSE